MRHPHPPRTRTCMQGSGFNYLSHLTDAFPVMQVSGILQHVDFLSQWQDHPDVLYAKPLVKAGEHCVCVHDGLPTWVCEIMVKKPTVQEAVEFIKDVEKSLDIPIYS